MKTAGHRKHSRFFRVPNGKSAGIPDHIRPAAESKKRQKLMAKKCRITVIRKAKYTDLSELYENPIDNPCCHEEGEVFIADGWNKPEGLCQTAWDTMSPFVMALVYGGSGFYDGWMKDPYSAMISCNDGFRPVSFLIELIKD